MKTITYKELMRLGFAKTTARKIIQQVKNIAIKRFEVADKNSINTVKLSKSHSGRSITVGTGGGALAGANVFLKQDRQRVAH
ncbi:MAG: DUF3173 family protein, partial [Streptococcus sp.]|nr:DUF3173 family protein [Streptococcus sp.]